MTQRKRTTKQRRAAPTFALARCIARALRPFSETQALTGQPRAPPVVASHFVYGSQPECSSSQPMKDARRVSCRLEGRRTCEQFASRYSYGGAVRSLFLSLILSLSSFRSSFCSQCPFAPAPLSCSPLSHCMRHAFRSSAAVVPLRTRLLFRTPHSLSMSTSSCSASSAGRRLHAVATHLHPLPGSPAGSLPPPLGAVSFDSLPSAEEQKRRDAARALLPWNRRVLDSTTGQVLKHVGEQSDRSLAAGAPIPPLFTPFHLGPLLLKNRLVVSPMCTYSSDDGFLNDWHIAHLGQFAIGGAAMAIVEATAVAPEGRISPTDSGLWKDERRRGRE